MIGALRLPSSSTLKSILLVVVIVVVDGFISNLGWRMVESRRSRIRAIGRAAAVMFALANVALAFYSFLRLWGEGWDLMMIALFVVGVVYAIRFGGAATGGGGPH